MNRQVPAFTTQEFQPRTSRYCLCIFTLNEVGRLQRQLAKIAASPISIDILICDGGSTDGTTKNENIKPYGVRAVLTKTGPGQLGAQMRMAFSYALDSGYEGVIVVDGNDKDDVVEGLARFIAALDEGYDHVQGSRFIPGGKHENTPLSRLIAVKVLHAPLLSLAAGTRYTDTTNGFRAYSRRFLSDPSVNLFRDVLSGYELHYYLAIEAARRGFRVCEVPVTRIYPREGKTPTKISPIAGNIKVLKTLFKSCLGCYSTSKTEFLKTDGS